MTNTLKITLPELHPGQRDVREHSARFKVVSAGRRWRKTSLGVLMCTDVGLRKGRAWWVGPTFPVASIGWRMLSHIADQIPGISKSEAERRITYPGGGWAQVKSAHDPDSLRGEGLDFCTLDECAFIPERAWTEGLRPALADRKGGALFISTPKGRNWFWQAWLRGQGDDPEWQSWRFSTVDNPFISPSEVEAAKRLLPEAVFRQEFEAEFIEDAGAVFRNVMACVVDKPERKGPVMIGVDWGKHQDFTVLTAIDQWTGHVVGWDRFNQIDYAVQRGRLAAMAERFKPLLILAESNAMGEPIIEQLQRDGLPVQGFTTTNASKAMLIEGLALAFEKHEIGIPGEQVLVNELQAFEMVRLPSGMVRYAAPDGMHDDCVISLALAWHAARGGRVIEGPVVI